MNAAKEAVRILALPEVRNRRASEGAEFVADTPEQFTAFLRSEIEKVGPGGESVRRESGRLFFSPPMDCQ